MITSISADTSFTWLLHTVQTRIFLLTRKSSNIDKTWKQQDLTELFIFFQAFPPCNELHYLLTVLVPCTLLRLLLNVQNPDLSKEYAACHQLSSYNSLLEQAMET